MARAKACGREILHIVTDGLDGTLITRPGGECEDPADVDGGCNTDRANQTLEHVTVLRQGFRKSTGASPDRDLAAGEPGPHRALLGLQRAGIGQRSGELLGERGRRSHQHVRSGAPRQVPDRCQDAVRAEVGEVRMPVREVLALKPGDVVGLGIPADAPMGLHADDVLLHLVRPGRHGRARAVQIVDSADAS